MNVFETLKSDLAMANDHIFVKEDQSYIIVVLANFVAWSIIILPLSWPEKLSGLYFKFFISFLFEIMYVAVYLKLNKSRDKSTVSIVRLAMATLPVIVIIDVIRIYMLAA